MIPHFIIYLLLTSSALWLDSGEVYELNTRESTIEWTGKKVLGEHHGTLSFEKGSLTLENEKLAAGTFVVDMHSMTNEDLKGNNREKLLNWLKSEEMFDVDNHPSARFEIVSVAATDDPALHQITGRLTIKEATHTVSFPASIRINDTGLEAEASFSFDREPWDLRYGSGGLISGIANTAIKNMVDVRVYIKASAVNQ